MINSVLHYLAMMVKSSKYGSISLWWFRPPREVINLWIKVSKPSPWPWRVLSCCDEVLDVLSLRIRGELWFLNHCPLSCSKNTPNSASLLPMPFALNCMMVKEFTLTACVGIDGGIGCGVGGVDVELYAQALIGRYFDVFWRSEHFECTQPERRLHK